MEHYVYADEARKHADEFNEENSKKSIEEVSEFIMKGVRSQSSKGHYAFRQTFDKCLHDMIDNNFVCLRVIELMQKAGYNIIINSYQDKKEVLVRWDGND